MSLNDVKLSKVVKKQYFFKLKAYSGIWMTMISVQIIAMLLSFLVGTGSSGGSINNISFSITVYSADLAIIFMVIWAFISAILLTGKDNRLADFTFVTNRLSSHLANVLFLMTASVLGGVTIHLSDKAMKLIVSSLFTAKQESFLILDSHVSSMFIGIVATVCYLLLFSMIGYFVGMLVQWFKGFIFILPSLFTGMIVIDVRDGSESVLLRVVEFFGMESSLFLFALKVIGTCIILIAMTIVFSNRLEVRR